MTHVWIVEDGEYSDRRIVAVCSSEQKAEQTAAMLGGVASQWAVDVPEQFHGMSYFGVTIDERGETADDWRFAYITVPSVPPVTRAWMSWQWKDDKDLPLEKRGGSGKSGARSVVLSSIRDDAWKVLRVWTWAKSRDHAVAHAQDLRRQLKASGEWDRVRINRRADTEIPL